MAVSGLRYDAIMGYSGSAVKSSAKVHRQDGCAGGESYIPSDPINGVSKGTGSKSPNSEHTGQSNSSGVIIHRWSASGFNNPWVTACRHNSC